MKGDPDTDLVALSEAGASTVVVVEALVVCAGAVASVAEVSVAVSVIVALGANDVPTLTTRVSVAVPTGTEVFVQEDVPPAPTAGLVQLQPPGTVIETKVVPAGRVSETVPVAALLGPALVTEMV